MRVLVVFLETGIKSSLVHFWSIIVFYHFSCENINLLQAFFIYQLDINIILDLILIEGAIWVTSLCSVSYYINIPINFALSISTNYN